jgi:hypothetical protein
MAASLRSVRSTPIDQLNDRMGLMPTRNSIRRFRRRTPVLRSVTPR